MTPDAVELRIPKERELAAVIAMLTRAYVHDRTDFPDDPSVLFRYSMHDPEGGPANWIVLWEGETPVAALRLFIRRVSRDRGRWETIGGIGNVGTNPDHGGRGLGSRAMHAAHDRLRRSDISTAVLVTDIPDFYRRFDYAPIPQRELRVSRTERVSAPAHEAVTAPVPAWIRRAHESATGACPGRVGRSEAYWDQWVCAFKTAAPQVDFVSAGDAYVIGRREEDGGAYRALEGGGAPEGVARLFDGLAAGAPTRKMPDDPLFRAVCALWGTPVEERTRSGIMCAALSPSGLSPEDLAGFLEIDTF